MDDLRTGGRAIPGFALGADGTMMAKSHSTPEQAGPGSSTILQAAAGLIRTSGDDDIEERHVVQDGDLGKMGNRVGSSGVNG